MTNETSTNQKNEIISIAPSMIISKKRKNKEPLVELIPDATEDLSDTENKNSMDDLMPATQSENFIKKELSETPLLDIIIPNTALDAPEKADDVINMDETVDNHKSGIRDMDVNTPDVDAEMTSDNFAGTSTYSETAGQSGVTETLNVVPSDVLELASHSVCTDLQEPQYGPNDSNPLDTAAHTAILHANMAAACSDDVITTGTNEELPHAANISTESLQQEAPEMMEDGSEQLRLDLSFSPPGDQNNNTTHDSAHPCCDCPITAVESEAITNDAGDWLSGTDDSFEIQELFLPFTLSSNDFTQAPANSDVATSDDVTGDDVTGDDVTELGELASPGRSDFAREEMEEQDQKKFNCTEADKRSARNCEWEVKLKSYGDEKNPKQTNTNGLIHGDDFDQESDETTQVDLPSDDDSEEDKFCKVCRISLVSSSAVLAPEFGIRT